MWTFTISKTGGHTPRYAVRIGRRGDEGESGTAVDGCRAGVGTRRHDDNEPNRERAHREEQARDSQRDVEAAPRALLVARRDHGADESVVNVRRGKEGAQGRAHWIGAVFLVGHGTPPAGRSAASASGSLARSKCTPRCRATRTASGDFPVTFAISVGSRSYKQRKVIASRDARGNA